MGYQVDAKRALEWLAGKAFCRNGATELFFWIVWRSSCAWSPVWSLLGTWLFASDVCRHDDHEKSNSDFCVRIMSWELAEFLRVVAGLASCGHLAYC